MATDKRIISRKIVEIEVIVRDKTPSKAKKNTTANKPVAAAQPAPVATVERKPLNEYSWAEIKEIGKRGDAEVYFSIGDTKEIILPNNDVLEVAIAGFYHDKDKDGNLIPITFTTVNTLEEDAVMNDENTNRGGWKESKMRKSLAHVLEYSLPADLRDLIVETDKGDTVDKLFLFNEIEVFGRTVYSDDNFGKQYPYYTKKSNRCKFKDSEESADWWWLRSPSASISTYFCAVNSSGNADGINASNSNGVAFGFGL